MIALFKQNIFLVSLSIIVYVVGLRFSSFITPEVYQLKPEDGPINAIFYKWVSNPMTQSIFTALLLFVQALMINRIGIKNRINKEIGLLPGVIYVLFICLIPLPHICYPIILANTFIIISLQYIFSTYNKKSVANAAFMSGFMASLASLIYFPYLYFFFITTISLLIMRSFSTKERLQHLIGWFIPYTLLSSWQYWRNVDNLVIPHYFKNQYAFFNLPELSSLNIMIFLGVTIVMVVYLIFRFPSFSSKKEITIQKKIDIFYWILLYGGVSIIFYNYVGFEHFATIALPIGYLLAMVFASIRNIVLAELLHLLLIGLIIYFQL